MLQNQKDSNEISNVIQMPQVQKANKKQSFTFGFVVGIFFLSFYLMKDFIYPKDIEQESAQELTLLDINFSYFPKNTKLASASLKVYSKNDSGDLVAETKTLGDFVGKPTIIHLWATFCGPCVHELPHYDNFSESSKDIQNIAIVSGPTDPKEIETFYNQKKIKNLTIVVDEEAAILKAYKLRGIPVSILINKKGKPLGYISGAVSWDDSSVVSLIKKVFKG